MYKKINYRKLTNAQRKEVYALRLKQLRELMDKYPCRKYKEYEEMTNSYFRKGWIAQQVHMRAV